MSGLLTLIVYIAIIGVIVWAVTSLIPMPAPFKTLIYVLGAIFCLLLLLNVVGGVNFALPRLR